MRDEGPFNRNTNDLPRPYMAINVFCSYRHANRLVKQEANVYRPRNGNFVCRTSDSHPHGAETEPVCIDQRKRSIGRTYTSS